MKTWIYRARKDLVNQQKGDNGFCASKRRNPCENMRKIAGITWWKNNYGSILQAYALGKVLNSFEGIEYEVIKQFSTNSFSLKMLMKRMKKEGLWKTFRYALNKFGHRQVRNRTQKCELFVQTHIKVAQEEYDENDPGKLSNIYDGFVCGSDQIWNPSITRRDSIYWLAIPNAKNKCAYAPSIGVTEASSSLRDEIKVALQDFRAISCREKEGSALINNILGTEKCITVLDPTLLLPKEEWDQIAVDPNIHQEYVFSYILRGTEKQRQLVKEFVKENNLILVTIPFLEANSYHKEDRNYGDIQVTEADPCEFIGLIKHARYVFTDSFHCMIFSCMYHKTFFSLYKLGKDQMLRINDFQKWLCLGNRIVDTEEDINRVLQTDEKEIWEAFERRVREERKNSMDFLVKSLDI